jgi:hypothetical protein
MGQDLLAKLGLSGRSEVSNYFRNYSRVTEWHLVPGLVDGVRWPLCATPVIHRGDRRISYFRFARYAIEGAESLALDLLGRPVAGPAAQALTGH